VLKLTWRLFAETGNIDTYLLLKELENEVSYYPNQKKREPKKLTSADFKM